MTKELIARPTDPKIDSPPRPSRGFWSRWYGGTKHALAMLFVFHLVCLSWLFFRTQGFNAARIYVKRMLRWKPAGHISLDPRDVAAGIVAILFLVLLIDLPQYLKKDHTVILRWHWVWKSIAIAVLLIGLILTKRTNDAAFIYFQF